MKEVHNISSSINSTCSNTFSTYSNSLFTQQQSLNVSHTSFTSPSSSSTVISSDNNPSIVLSHERTSNGLLTSSPQAINGGDIFSSSDKNSSIDVHLSSSQQFTLDEQEVTESKQKSFFDSCMISILFR
jgi:hypothetical protein